MEKNCNAALTRSNLEPSDFLADCGRALVSQTMPQPDNHQQVEAGDNDLFFSRGRTTRQEVAAMRSTRRQRAQDVVEYSLLVATIAIIVLMAIASFGQRIEPWFAALASRITAAGT